MSAYRDVMPFTALVGQEAMKNALVLNAINPGIGGVLIRGERGTAKSTAVRALPRLLPEIGFRSISLNAERKFSSKKSFSEISPRKE